MAPDAGVQVMQRIRAALGAPQFEEAWDAAVECVAGSADSPALTAEAWRARMDGVMLVMAIKAQQWCFVESNYLFAFPKTDNVVMIKSDALAAHCRDATGSGGYEFKYTLPLYTINEIRNRERLQQVPSPPILSRPVLLYRCLTAVCVAAVRQVFADGYLKTDSPALVEHLAVLGVDVGTGGPNGGETTSAAALAELQKMVSPVVQTKGAEFADDDEFLTAVASVGNAVTRRPKPLHGRGRRFLHEDQLRMQGSPDCARVFVNMNLRAIAYDRNSSSAKGHYFEYKNSRLAAMNTFFSVACGQNSLVRAIAGFQDAGTDGAEEGTAPAAWATRLAEATHASPSLPRFAAARSYFTAVGRRGRTVPHDNCSPQQAARALFLGLFYGHINIFTEGVMTPENKMIALLMQIGALSSECPLTADNIPVLPVYVFIMNQGGSLFTNGVKGLVPDGSAFSTTGKDMMKNVFRQLWLPGSYLKARALPLTHPSSKERAMPCFFAVFPCAGPCIM